MSAKVIAAGGFETASVGFGMPFIVGQGVTRVTTANTGSYAAQITGYTNKTDCLYYNLGNLGDFTVSCYVRRVGASAFKVCLTDTAGDELRLVVFPNELRVVFNEQAVKSVGVNLEPDTYTGLEMRVIGDSSAGSVVVKVNDVILLDYTGQTISSGAKYNSFYIAPYYTDSIIIVDDIAIGHEDWIGRVKIYPVSFNGDEASAVYTVQPPGASIRSVLSDGEGGTYVRLYYNAEVVVNSNQTLAQAFNYGGCVYGAFGGTTPPIGGVFLVLNNADFADGKIASSSRSHFENGGHAGKICKIISNNPFSPAIECYAGDTVFLASSVSPIQNGITLGYSIHINTAVSKETTAKIGGAVGIISGDNIVVRYGDEVDAGGTTSMFAENDSGKESATIIAATAVFFKGLKGV